MAGTGLGQERGGSASQPRVSGFAFPSCLIFQGLRAPPKHSSYASRAARSINHLKDELIISELLRHAEGQADKFSLRGGEVLMGGEQVDDKRRSLRGSR